MPAQKKIPMRQCLGCREMKPKRELIRVVRSPEGEISLDAVKSRALERAFSTAIPSEIYDRLREEMERGE